MSIPKIIAMNCEWTDHETGEKAWKSHCFIELMPTPLQTRVNLKPGGLNFMYRSSALKVCVNCRLVVGKAG